MDVQRTHGKHRDELKLGLDDGGGGGAGGSSSSGAPLGWPSDDGVEGSLPPSFRLSSSLLRPLRAAERQRSSPCGADDDIDAPPLGGTARENVMVMRNWAVVEGSSGRSALMITSARDIPPGSRLQLHCMRCGGNTTRLLFSHS